jgi:homogentisate 1,2-dioxygenase
MPPAGTDWLDGMTTMLANRDPADLEGVAVHVYACNRDMARVFVDADGELVFLPQSGRLTILTELGRIDIAPGQIALVPRGVRFRVELPDGEASGYVAENHGSLFRLPDLGPIGANGLGNPRDFETPVAWFEDRDEPTQVVQKFLGSLWTMTLDHSPLDVVAWHGNLAPWRYDLSRFNTINTVSFDHPDPSIFTLLTSPSDVPGRANADLVLFPPRWMVAEDSFRPPWFHRNVDVEAMGLITGAYDAKAEGFRPGGCLCTIDGGARPRPRQLAGGEHRRPQAAPDRGTMAFMVESCWPYRPTTHALSHAQLDYDAVWKDFPRPGCHELTLHGYWRSSAAYRVRLALALKGLSYDSVSHDLRTGAQRAEAYRALQPQGLVPVLDGPDGALIQSPAILEWLEERYPDPPLLPADPAGRAVVRAMAAVVACDIHPINNLRVLTMLRQDMMADEDAIRRWIAHWIAEGFAALEGLIARHGRGYAYGDTRRWPTAMSCRKSITPSGSRSTSALPASDRRRRPAATPGFEAAPEAQEDAG